MLPVDRERTLLRWAGSPLVMRRSGVNAFRKLLTFTAYADPGLPDAPNPLPEALGCARRFDDFEDALARTDFGPHRGTVASAHQMGTIRADARGSVVPGLYVAETSTFPTGIGVNPVISVMAMARRVARTVLAESAPD
jgi:choline dehydrogenase-like flavoprotein